MAGRVKKNDATVNDDIAVKESVSAVNTKKAAEAKLNDSDEIEVVSLIPNVSYEDKKTGDMYIWESVGHIEYMAFSVLKDMWRSHKGYFRNLVLKPLDERVISHFSLQNLYDSYDYLMDSKNYTRDKIADVCNKILDTPSGLRNTIYGNIRAMVDDGKMTDINIIKYIDNTLGMELLSTI